MVVAVSTTYRFRIEIDDSRKAHIYINDALVHTTAALTDDINFIPFIAIQNLGAFARSLTIAYEKISRHLFE